MSPPSNMTMNTDTNMHSYVQKYSMCLKLKSAVKVSNYILGLVIEANEYLNAKTLIASQSSAGKQDWCKG